jgi:hypothetical protein
VVADLGPRRESAPWKGRLDACVERPKDEEHTEFTRRPMFRWLSPGGLVTTGARVLLAGIFGQYSDKRELEGIFPGRNIFDHSKEDEGRDYWVDFVSDLGDGFDPTYSIAWLLAHEQLEVDGVEGPLPRGRMLVMGGDQVYPAATESNYQDRLVGPYRAALPCVKDGPPPSLYVLPGNHDWYDGLTTFLRLFCRKQWIGGWQTQQERSYFATRLPRGWWLWGLDIQLDFYIDEPQLDFFRGVAQRVMPDERVILITARPSWVQGSLAGHAASEEPSVRNLEYFERKIIRDNGVDLAAVLTGDDHHYVRYESPAGLQRITCGGGGAFLSPTHQLKDPISWDESGGKGDPTTYSRRGVFPSIPTSRRLRWGVILSPFRNPSFVVLAAAIHLVFAWMILFALRGAQPAFLPVIRNATVGPLVRGLGRNPVSLVLAIVLVAGLYLFADADDPWRRSKKLLMGVLHAAGHLTAVIAVIWVVSKVPLEGVMLKAAFYVLIVLLGGIGGALVMGLYLFVTHFFWRRHVTEAFSAMHLEDYKGFLRMRIDRDGGLTIFPIGVERVCRDWRFVSPRDASNPGVTDPWFEPEEGSAPSPALIEAPIEIGRRVPR